MRHRIDSENCVSVQHGQIARTEDDLIARDLSNGQAPHTSSTGDDYASEIRWFKRFVRVHGDPLPEIPS